MGIVVGQWVVDEWDAKIGIPKIRDYHEEKRLGYEEEWFGFQAHAFSGLYHFPSFFPSSPVFPTIVFNMEGKTE
jgi:hypothetical protein